MNRIALLLLLQKLLRDAVCSYTPADDHSGINTTYLVDHERLMANIERELEQHPPELRIVKDEDQ